MKQCVVNVAAGKIAHFFLAGQARQSEALDNVGFTGDKIYWRDYPLSSPPHTEVPYSFKPHALSHARDLGYDLALWLDASVMPIKPIDFYFDQIDREGHVIIENVSPAPGGRTWNTGEWCRDEALQTLGITREESFSIPHPSAGILGLNFNNDRANKFLNQWLSLSEDGITFQGPWTNENSEASPDPRVLGHRHDQTAAGVIAHRLGMQMLPPTKSRVAYESQEIPPDTILLIKGIEPAH